MYTGLYQLDKMVSEMYTGLYQLDKMVSVLGQLEKEVRMQQSSRRN